MVMQPKRHHYVPQFYLEYFAREQPGKSTPGFFVYDKEGAEPRFQTAVNTAVEGYFYSLEQPDGSRDHSVEKMLADVESATKPILDGWLTTDSRRLDREEVAQVAQFLALLHTRGPRNIDAIREMTVIFAQEQMKDLASHSAELQAMLDEMKAEEGTEWSLDEAIEALRTVEERVRLKIVNKYPLVASLQQTDAIVRELRSMYWSFGIVTGDKFYVTGDTPVCVFLPFEGGTASFGGGFGNPRVQVTFPLSPQRCLVLSHSPDQTPLRLAEVNRRTAHVAERFIISPVESSQVAALLERTRSTRRLPKMDREEFGQTVREALKRFRALDVQTDEEV